MRASSSLAGVLAQAVSIVVWQSGLIVQKMLVADANAGSLMLIQLGAAVVLMWFFLALAGRLPEMDRRTALSIAWGMAAPGLVFGFGISGAARTDGVSVALIWGLMSLLGPLLAYLLLKEPIHWTMPVGGVIGFIGLALLTLSRASLGTSDMIGNLLILAAVICSSLSVVIGRTMNAGGARPWSQVATLQVTGGLITTSLLILVSGWKPPDFSNPVNLWAIGYLVLAMTVVNFLAFNLALALVPAAWIALNSSFAPVVGLLSAWLLLGSVVRPLDVLCALVILCGVALPHLRRLLMGR